MKRIDEPITASSILKDADVNDADDIDDTDALQIAASAQVEEVSIFTPSPLLWLPLKFQVQVKTN